MYPGEVLRSPRQRTVGMTGEPMRIVSPEPSQSGAASSSPALERVNAPALDTLRVLSLNHHGATLEILDRVALGPREVHSLLRILKESGVEAVVLATCNRVELYWSSRHSNDDGFVERALERVWADPPRDWIGFAQRHEGAAAARHFLRVAAGLESLVVGESEILGQTRAALELAQSEGVSGAVLDELFRAGLRFGRKARSSTRIGSGALSTASAAVQTLRRTHPDFSQLTAVVLGAGQTVFKAAEHLRS